MLKCRKRCKIHSFAFYIKTSYELFNNYVRNWVYLPSFIDSVLCSRHFFLICCLQFIQNKSKLCTTFQYCRLLYMHVVDSSDSDASVNNDWASYSFFKIHILNPPKIISYMWTTKYCKWLHFIQCLVCLILSKYKLQAIPSSALLTSSFLADLRDENVCDWFSWLSMMIVSPLSIVIMLNLDLVISLSRNLSFLHAIPLSHPM